MSLNELIKTLGHENNNSLIAKSEELLRKLQLKTFASSLNDVARVVICIDLSAKPLGIILDKNICIKTSGLTKSEYKKNLNMLEKFLGLSPPITISNICIQLGISHISQSAEQLLEKYKSNIRDDSTHPQYAAMAIYQACVQQKVKILKKRIMDFSNLKSAQWEILAKQWNKYMDEIKNDVKTITEKESVDDLKVEEKMDLDENVSNKPQKEEEIIENFEDFKKRILLKSYISLKKNNQLNTAIFDIHLRCLELFDCDIEDIRDEAYKKYLLFEKSMATESDYKDYIDAAIYAVCDDQGRKIPKNLLKGKEHLKNQLEKLAEIVEGEDTTEQVIDFNSWVKKLQN